MADREQTKKRAGKTRTPAGPPPTSTGKIQQVLRAANATSITVEAGGSIIRQGDLAAWVYYLVQGKVQISVISKQGKEGMIAPPLVPGDFIGESSLSGQNRYLASAKAVDASELIKVPKEVMMRLVREDADIGARFTAFLLQHAMAVEAELVDHLFNSSEKRLARILLLLANFSNEGKLEPITNMTQELLAQRVGTTRARISYFMNKFRKLGLITYNGSIQVRSGLLNVVLNDARLEKDRDNFPAPNAKTPGLKGAKRSQP